MDVGIAYDTQDAWATPGFRLSYFNYTDPPATQRYEFDDIQTGEHDVLVPGPDSAATITRSIMDNRSPYLPSLWWYTCTKNNVTSWLQLNQ